MVQDSQVVLCTYPQFSPFVGSDALRIGAHGDFLRLGEGGEVNDGDGRVVAGGDISAGVDYVELVTEDTELVGLVPDLDLTRDAQGSSVDLIDRTKHIRIGDRAYIRTDIHLIALESEVATVREVYLTYMAGLEIHDLHLVRAVDDGIEPSAVPLYIVAHVT